MKRSSKHTIKYVTAKKKDLLNQMFLIWGDYLQKTIDLMWDKKVPTGKYLSSKQIDWMGGLGGQYKSLIYKQASEIVRGAKAKKGKKSKPKVENFCADFNIEQVKIELSKTNEFDMWVKLRLPFIKEGEKGKRPERIEILIPIKEHRQSLKFKDWKRAAGVKISKNFVTFTYEIETPEKKETGDVVGIDMGYKKLLATSDGKMIGSEMECMYEKISRKRQGSKSFKRALVERDNKINYFINRDLCLDSTKELVIENLCNVKKGEKGKKRKIRKVFMNKLQRWSYQKCGKKLEMLCEENRVLLTRVDPAFTSQQCSVCGSTDKKSRCGERFLCVDCGKILDADYNAAVNLSHMGVYNPHALKEGRFSIMLLNGFRR